MEYKRRSSRNVAGEVGEGYKKQKPKLVVTGRTSCFLGWRLLLLVIFVGWVVRWGILG